MEFRPALGAYLMLELGTVLFGFGCASNTVALAVTGFLALAAGLVMHGCSLISCNTEGLFSTLTTPANTSAPFERKTYE